MGGGGLRLMIFFRQSLHEGGALFSYNTVAYDEHGFICNCISFAFRELYYSIIFILNKKRSHPRPRVTKLGPDDCVDWVFVSKPVLTTAIDDTAFNTLQNIPGKKEGDRTKRGIKVPINPKFIFRLNKSFYNPEQNGANNFVFGQNRNFL